MHIGACMCKQILTTFSSQHIQIVSLSVQQSVGHTQGRADEWVNYPECHFHTYPAQHEFPSLLQKQPYVD